MLRINGLHKSFKGFRVLTGLDMSLDKGDVYGFLGTNGCGKTTTMNIICNIIPKDEGEVTFGSADMKVGYLPETPALYGYMNAYEYLDFIGACCEYQGDIKKRTAEVLEITGMTHGAKRLIKGYSRGMNQRVGIAAAMYANPDLLILDEPTSALDPEGRAEVMEIIRKLADAGSTIILCTHILTDVERVANKVGIMRDGLIKVEGGIQEVKDRFAGKNAVTVRLRDYTPEAVTAICSVDLAERSEANSKTGVTVFGRDGVSEKELYNKVIATLADKDILPESIEFKRITLEQIYIGVSNGVLV
jgi:ABC-2 type transport system ATP-binding protein